MFFNAKINYVHILVRKEAPQLSLKVASTKATWFLFQIKAIYK